MVPDDLRRGPLGGTARDHASDDLERFVPIDSTIVRAHHHAAGARKGGVVPEDLSTIPNATGGPVERRENAT